MIKWLSLASVIATGITGVLLVFPAIFMFAMSFDDSKNLSNPLNWLIGMVILAVPLAIGAAALFSGIFWYQGNYALALKIAGSTLVVLMIAYLIFNHYA